MTSSRQFPIKPFRFGVQASSQPDRKSWIDLAQRTEAAGFDVLTMPDHFTDQLAPVPALMSVADATKKLRVGALVWDNDYKHPVVLAKELATMDLLSDGRL
ncbi:MAG: LLM class flavin-dependent oxidoreductase, partial [Actinobacteria bacterium]|nr:LLM class flavin-dependent oxidoreductase [Actinomycetota bacterium]